MWNSFNNVRNDLFPKIFYINFVRPPIYAFPKILHGQTYTYSAYSEGCRKNRNKARERVYIPGASNNGSSLYTHGSIDIIVFLTPPTQWVGQVKCAHTNHVPGQRSGGPKMYWRNANYARITMPGSHSRPDATGHSAWCCPTTGMRGPLDAGTRAFSRAAYRSSAVYTRQYPDTISPCSWPCSWFCAILWQVNGEFRYVALSKRYSARRVESKNY